MASAPSSNLTHYDTARRELALATEIDEVKEIRDKTQALEIYFRQSNDRTMEQQAAMIRIRAERKCGELIREKQEKRELPKGRPEKESSGTTLSDLGISRDQSSKFQKLADIPEDEFEQRRLYEPIPGQPSARRRTADSSQSAGAPMKAHSTAGSRSEAGSS